MGSGNQTLRSSVVDSRKQREDSGLWVKKADVEIVCCGFKIATRR